MPGFGFPKTSRLNRPGEFRAVFDQATFKVSTRCLLVFANRNGLDTARLGLVIGKKNVALATQRNRLKRLMRTSFRLNQQLLSGLDIVILARSSLDSLSNDQVTGQLHGLWQDLAKKSRPEPSATRLGP